jgi:NAD(P)-dependent dehydrogenase (short-subunit alcohol dehydrogenase family)
MGDRLKDKVCIVTGGGRGIGRAVVQRFAREGANVLAVSVGDSGKAVAREAGPAVEFFQCDVARPEQVQAMTEYCVQRFGRLDVLVNNAGKGHDAHRLHDIPLETWDEVMAVNVRGAFVVMKYCLPLMLQYGGGSIVNMASVGSFRATPMFGAYIASKHTMLALTRNAALEYARDNIRVNSVCPGLTATDILLGAPEEARAFLASQVPQGRPCTTDEVANLTLFLASDEASHITGGSYVIDGGRCAG